MNAQTIVLLFRSWVFLDKERSESIEWFQRWLNSDASIRARRTVESMGVEEFFCSTYSMCKSCSALGYVVEGCERCSASFTARLNQRWIDDKRRVHDGQPPRLDGLSESKHRPGQGQPGRWF